MNDKTFTVYVSSELNASKSPLPVVADFWTPSCQSCQVFAPTFKKAARLFAGRSVCGNRKTVRCDAARNIFKTGFKEKFRD